MCLIVIKQDSKTHTDGVQFPFDAVWSHNSDGFGIAQAIGGKLYVRKTLKREKARRMFLDAMRAPYPFVAHFRFRTRGKATILNVHPFKIGRHSLVMAHNGTLETAEGPQGESDSLMFARGVLAPLADIAGVPSLLDKNSKMHKIIETMTRRSLIALMRGTGEVAKFGDGWTKWRDLDCSNAYSLIPPRPYKAAEVTGWTSAYGTPVDGPMSRPAVKLTEPKSEVDYGDAAAWYRAPWRLQ